MTLIKPERFVEDKEQIKIPRTKKEIEDYLKVLPNPVGYRILIKPYAGRDKTKGGVILSEKTKVVIYPNLASWDLKKLYLKCFFFYYNVFVGLSISIVYPS